MKISKSILAIVLIGSNFVAATGSNAAGAIAEYPANLSIERCVQEIYATADFDGAASVRHNVSVNERRSGRQVMKIETLVFGDEQETLIREYATVCGVSPNASPDVFRLHETTLR